MAGDHAFSRAARAGFAYAAIVFAAGFAFGTLRVLVAAPRLGEEIAVLAELPMILAVSWIACRWLVARLAVPATVPARSLMGALAFIVLVTAEVFLGIWGLGRSVSEQIARYGSMQDATGLAAQILFAAFPVVQTLPARPPGR